jgi:dephospho-CoA kinase
MAPGTFSIGLTGGIGSGKTTVANLFSTMGAAVIDTDQIAHQLTGAGGIALPAIREQFGDRFIADDGTMDRTKMREFVFSNPTARKHLESILHPLIRSETERAAKLATGTYLMFVVPLLVESPEWQKQVTRILVVDCPEDLQVKRVVQRNGLPESQVRAIIATQATRQARCAAADDIILNHGDTAESLVPEISRLHTLYTNLAKSHGNEKSEAKD